ncbi:MAG: hypothetical protein LBN32_00360 [Helicobacteraceae bacterium]|jgi:hypothetical protein|nr:hypothetical protein [Helicobacteraceae bacterium]
MSRVFAPNLEAVRYIGDTPNYLRVGPVPIVMNKGDVVLLDRVSATIKKRTSRDFVIVKGDFHFTQETNIPAPQTPQTPQTPETPETPQTPQTPETPETPTLAEFLGTAPQAPLEDAVVPPESAKGKKAK